MNTLTHKVRGICFGQDRYHRQYWALPRYGGIFVEAVESAESKEEIKACCEPLSPEDEEEETVKKTVDNEEKVTKTEDGETIKGAMEKEGSVDLGKVDGVTEAKPDLDSCKMETSLNSSENIKENGDTGKNIACDSPDTKTDVKPAVNGNSSLKEEEEEECGKSAFTTSVTTTNLFLQKPNQTKFSDFIQMPKTEEILPSSIHSAYSGTNNTQNSAFSPAKTECKSAFKSIDSILSPEVKSPTRRNLFSSGLFQSSLFTSTPFQSRTALNSSYSLQGPWFSILPKKPCDASSICQLPTPQKQSTISPQSQSQLTINTSTCSKQTSPQQPHISPFHMHSPTYSSFQLSHSFGRTPLVDSSANNSQMSESNASLLHSSQQILHTEDELFKTPSNTVITEAEVRAKIAAKQYKKARPVPESE